MPRVILAISAATFLLFGVLYLVDPVGMVGVVELRPTASTSITDLRAVYGGLELGVAALLFACLANEARTTDGLVMAAVLFGGLVVGRCSGMLADGDISKTTWRVLAGEGFALGGCLLGLFLRARCVRRGERPSAR